jgi:hypothetical protein
MTFLISRKVSIPFSQLQKNWQSIDFRHAQSILKC